MMTRTVDRSGREEIDRYECDQLPGTWTMIYGKIRDWWRATAIRGGEDVSRTRYVGCENNGDMSVGAEGNKRRMQRASSLLMPVNVEGKEIEN